MTLALGHADGAQLSGGRIGGGSFRAPSRTYAPPSRIRTTRWRILSLSRRWIWVSFPDSPLGIGGGFGGLFSILILAIANFLVQAFRRVGSGEIEVGYSSNPVSVTRLQVGLLAEGRSLQTELNRIAETAIPTPEGRTEVLQEASLAFYIRNIRVYSTTQQARLLS